MAQTLDYFMPNVITQDTRKRMQCHGDLVSYLQNPQSSLYCEEMDKFVDGVASWVSSSNYKVSLNGLEVISCLIDRMGDHFKSHVTTVLPAVTDRLGDQKEQVRDSSQEVVLKLMVPASTPQYVLDRLYTAFTHKLWRVREEVCICVSSTLNQFGAKTLSLSKLVPTLIKLLEDQSIPVREAAINTLVEIYRHVGERVRQDLNKKDINAAKLNTLNNKMDEVRDSGNMIATSGQDELDFVRPSGVPKASKRFPSASSASSATSTGTTRRPSSSKTPSGSGSTSAGALDEEAFTKGFEDVPKVHLFSARELTDRCGKIKDTLADTSQDWEKRVDALKEIRGVVIAGAMDYDEFTSILKSLEMPMANSVKDLRSQVVREACITIAYLSQQLRNKFSSFAESLLPNLIPLIPNSAKIMATSGTVCIRTILQNTHSQRLVPIMCSYQTSKSKEIRRQCIEFTEQILRVWPTHTLEKHIAVLQEAIKKSLNDQDPEARTFARRAFWSFAEHFREQADSLMNQLDTQKQKLLQGEMSHSSSNNSLTSLGVGSSATASQADKSKSRVRSVSTERGTLQYNRTLGSAGTRRSKTPSHTDTTDGQSATGSRRVEKRSNGIQRSNSAVDLAGAPTGPTRTYNGPSGVQASSSSSTSSNYNSLPRPKKTSSSSTAQSILSPERSRPRAKVGVSQSQPSSRSGSPSSRLSYITHTQTDSAAAASSSSRTPTARRTRIPRSQGASREGSPSRAYGRERKMSGHGVRGLTQRGQPSKGDPINPPVTTSILAQRTLMPGTEVEDAVADALLIKEHNRRRYQSYESDDAASETSSVCSERSYSSYGKTSEDMAEIMSNLGSGSWADRKEGLIALQNLLRGTRMLNRLELKKVTEMFTRMFHDPHGKVFSLFMETLVELIVLHRTELQDWLYICLTRLLTKMGSDLLGSVQTKVQRSLETVRDSFAYDHQFSILTRFIVDQTQTPNLKVKVKVALLNYLHGLALLMDPADFINNSDNRLAVSRIITWTTEPKNVDVRKASQAVLIALFNLNTPEFTMMLQQLPKTFQDGATKILHNHLRSASQESEVLSPRNVTSPTGSSFRYRPSPNRSNIEDDTENMNPEDVVNSFRKATADIQNLSKLDEPYDDIRKGRDTTSQDSGIQGSLHDIRLASPDSKDSPRSERRRQYNPNFYQDDSLNNYNKSALAEAVFDVENDLFNEEFPGEATDVVGEILRELSNHNTRNEERKNAMLNLIRITRESAPDVWDENFKTILLLLLETLGDSDGQIRALSLRVLREILRHQAMRFKEYAALTVLKILEAHKDTAKEVCRAAEECANTLAHYIPADQCIQVLNPIIQTAEYPINLAAIKMETKVMESSERHVIERLLPEIIPGLVKGYDNSESSVRKASVFCLVALYMVMGEDLRQHISDLNGSKMKLLNLYIKRAMSDRTSSCNTSKTTSPASTITDL